MHIKSQPLRTDALKQISGESRQIKVDVRHPPGSPGDISKSLVLECGKKGFQNGQINQKTLSGYQKTHWTNEQVVASV